MSGEARLRLASVDDDLGCDVVIVGSGAAGATVAWTLADAGWEVLVLEEGRLFEPSDFQAEVGPSLSRLYRDFGATPALGRTVIPLLQARAVGGTTVANAAIAWKMPAALLENWHREHGLDSSLAADRMEAAYEATGAATGITEVSPALLGGNGRLMAAGAAALGIAGHPIRRFEVGCQGSGRCIQGCPHGAKRSMDRTLLPAAVARGARILAGARVLKLEAGPAGGAVVRFKAGGRIRRVAPRRGVVVAASATGSAPLLRRSGVRHRGLGEGFMLHPGLGVAGVFDEPVEMGRGATQAWESGHFWNRRFKLESLSLPPALAIARLPGFGASLVARLDELEHTAVWAVQVRARAEGTVQPGWFGPRIRYDLGDGDLQVVRLGVETLCQMMFAAGARRVFPGIHGMPEVLDHPRQIDTSPLIDPRQAHFIATHLFGGARMGPDPIRHPVDLDWKVRGLDRVWVVDSSVFPTNLGVNPQWTIMAVARLAAERIAEAA